MATDDFSQSSPQVALYKECVAKAANDGRALMDALVEKARQSLQQKSQTVSDPVERQQLVEAARQLNVHSAMLIERYPLSLMGAFSESLAQDSTPRALAPADAPAKSGLKFDELELMDESQVQESIELARAQQTALAVAEAQLSELNGLMCAVLGLKTVQPDRNPLRPEMYVKGLRTLLTLTGTDNHIRVSWMQAMGAALGEPLKITYADICRLLQSRGVRPVGYVVTQTAQPGGAPGGTSGTRGSRGGAPGGFPGGRGGGGGTGGTGYGYGPGTGSGSGGGSGGGGGSTGSGRSSGGASGAGSGGADPGAAGASGSGGRQYAQQTLLTVDQLRRLLAGELDSARQGLVSAVNVLTAQGGKGGDRAGRGQGASGTGTAASASGGASSSTRGNAPQPRDGSSSRPQGEDAEPQHQDFGDTVPAAFEALEEMRQVERVIKRLSDRQTSAGALPGDRERDTNTGPSSIDGTFDALRRDAKGVGQALGLEVVNLMFENIAQDAHLLPPVQAVIRRVEPAYLRLALIDPRFFSDKQHVARQLLEQMTERSLAYATIMAPGFEPFLKSMRAAAEVLAISQIRDVEPFDRALKTLQKDWRGLAERENKQRDKAVHTLLHAEQRNVLAERLANDLRERPGANMAPVEIINFLCGPWAQVLAEARLRDRKGAPDPGGYLAIVNDLIWTTQPEQTRVNLERTKAMMVPMLERLRDGLLLIDYPQPQIDAFAVLLMSLYDSMQQPGQSAINENALRAQNNTALDSVGETRDPWLRPTEMQDTGFFDVPEEAGDKPEFKQTETLFESTSPQLSESEEDKRAAERAKPPIPAGAWVELRLHDQTMRAQLTWSSPYGTLFMFTDADGTTHSLTRRALDKLLARGSVTLISQGVVDVALNAVAETAMRNTIDLTL